MSLSTIPLTFPAKHHGCENKPNLERLSELQRKVSEIPLPESYKHGIDAERVMIPTRVMLLVHKNAEAFRITEPKYSDCNNRFVLAVSLKGSGDVILDDAVFRLRSGQGILVFPFQLLRYANIERGDICWLFFSFMLKEYHSLNSLGNVPLSLSDTSLTFIESLIQAYLSKDHDCPEINSQVSLLMGLVLEELHFINQRKMKEHVGQVLSGKMPELVRKVGQFVHDNIARPIQTADIAQYIQMSPSHLRSVFKARVGLCIGSYIRRARIMRASCLLETTQLSLSVISQLCGFNSLFSFSRTFKNEVGLAPSHYRKASCPEGGNQAPGPRR